MSSTNKTANYQLSQFVGTDIPSILNDYNGDMRKIDTAIKAVANAEGSSQSDIAGLQATVGQHTTEISGINSTVNSLSGRVVGIEGKIPANASESNKLITAQDIPEIPSVEQLEQDVANLQTNVGDLQEEVSVVSGDVKAIELCVPSTASESNKFATMADIGGSSVEVLYESEAFETWDSVLSTIQSMMHNMNVNERARLVLDVYRAPLEHFVANITDNYVTNSVSAGVIDGVTFGCVVPLIGTVDCYSFHCEMTVGSVTPNNTARRVEIGSGTVTSNDISNVSYAFKLLKI